MQKINSSIAKRKTAPLSAAQLKQLKLDAKNVRATAERKEVTLDKWEENDEMFHATHYFELGCWLFYYSARIYSPEGVADRIDCMRRIFEAGLDHLNYEFFSVFDFGERQFDTLVETGDAEAVIDGVRKRINDSWEGQNVRAAFKYMGWPIQPEGINMQQEHSMPTKCTHGISFCACSTCNRSQPRPDTDQDLMVFRESRAASTVGEQILKYLGI
ncbi:MAG: hypothetical protein U0989_03610 [Azonexus sp.]|nr:hypothetical protein [Azonexus sp.]